MQKQIPVLLVVATISAFAEQAYAQYPWLEPYRAQACDAHTGSSCTSFGDTYYDFTYVGNDCTSACPGYGQGLGGYYTTCDVYTIDDNWRDQDVELVSGDIDYLPFLVQVSATYWDSDDQEWEPNDDDESGDLDFEDIDSLGNGWLRYSFIEWNDYVPASSSDSLYNWDYTYEPLIRYRFREASFPTVGHCVEIWYEGPDR